MFVTLYHKLKTKIKKMKNLKNTVLMMVVATILTFATSCKKHEEVKPQVITNQNPSITVNFNTTDSSFIYTAIDDESVSKVEVYKDGVLVVTLTEKTGIYDIPKMSVGTHKFTFKVFDNKNMTNSVDGYVTVNPSTIINKAPVFKNSSISLPINSTSINFKDYITDEDLSKVKIKSIINSSNVVTIDTTGKISTPKIYAGIDTISISITDGINVTTSKITVNIGSTNEINTYNTLTPFLNKLLQGDNLKGLIKFNIDGTVYLSTQQTLGVGSMFPNNTPAPSTSPSTYTYNIYDSNLNINVGLKYTYTINIINNSTLQLNNQYTLYQ